jgi:hypothetical protein
MASPESTGYEAASLRRDNAATSTTSAPSGATDGILVQNPRGPRRKRVHLQIQKGAASGTRTARVKVYGYISKLRTVTEPTTITDIASSGCWYEIFDTDELSEAADFNRSWLLYGATDFSRLETAVLTNAGTTPTLTTAFAFSIAE